MRIARVRTPDNQIKYGIVENEAVVVVKGDILGKWEKTSERLPLDEVKLLAPVVPGNILAIGKNYIAHAEELKHDVPNEPVLFIKANSSINDPGAPIVIPKMAPDEIDYEGELVIVIKTKAKNVSREKALDYVLGYTCGNDVSARDCQFKFDSQWARGKSFDTFAPIGPWIETELNPFDCNVTSRLNGEVMQQANTSLMIFDVAYLVSYLSRCMTLLPGTIIMSGTPAGCGFGCKPPVYLKPGDVMEVEIEGIGLLKNKVVAED